MAKKSLDVGTDQQDRRDHLGTIRRYGRAGRQSVAGALGWPGRHPRPSGHRCSARDRLSVFVCADNSVTHGDDRRIHDGCT